jgi:hypothetical protein
MLYVYLDTTARDQELVEFNLHYTLCVVKHFALAFSFIILLWYEN